MSEATAPAASRPARGGALLVAAGILLSRLSGRCDSGLRALLGTGCGDAYTAALRIRTSCKIYWRGVLSARSSRCTPLCGQGPGERARKVAGAVAGLVAWQRASSRAGILATPWLIDLIAPGFKGRRGSSPPARRDLLSRPCRSWPERVLPGRPQQPPQVLPQLCGAGPLERGHRRRPVLGGARWKLGRFPGHRCRLGNGAGSALQLLVQLPAVLQLLAGRARSSLARPGPRDPNVKQSSATSSPC